jgi:hypothetical protein
LQLLFDDFNDWEGKEMNVMKSVVSLVMFAGLIFLAGCTRSVITNEYPVDPKTSPEIAGHNSIAIVNAQTDTKEILIGTNMGLSFIGNMQQFTDTVIETLKTELSKKNIPTSKDAQKTLKVSVSKTTLDPGTWGFGSDTYVTVETGDGYKKELVGKGGGAVVRVAINSSVNAAAVAILNDEAVIAFLRR